MIQHRGERKGNAARRRLATYQPRAMRTYTPSLAAISRAEGSYLYTVDGRRLTDFSSGVLVANLGHNHPLFEQYYAAYCEGLPRTSYNFVTPLENDASQRLVRSMKTNPNAQKVLWAASGSEAIQKAMWAALRYQPDKHIVLATRRGFHGKKGLAGDVSGEESANPNVRWVSFPGSEARPETSYLEELDELAAAYPNQINLLITEPYLGAAGSYHPPKWYHALLQDWCRKNNVTFIFDEIQSCHGRTGRMYAYETYGVEPDLVVAGKGLGNGEPVAVVVGRADILDSLDYGDASDTFSGNPRACAAVCAGLDVFREQRIIKSLPARSEKLHVVLQNLKDQFSFITDVRGEGMVYGVEMVSGEVANECVLEAYHGIGGDGVHFLGPLSGNVLRVSPPLTITPRELEEAVRVLRASWARVRPPVSPLV